MGEVLPFLPVTGKPASDLIEHAKQGAPPAVVLVLPAIRPERYADADCPSDTNPPDNVA